MDHLSHNEGVIGVGAQVTANGLRGFAAGTTAAVWSMGAAPAPVVNREVLTSGGIAPQIGGMKKGIVAMSQRSPLRTRCS